MKKETKLTQKNAKTTKYKELNDFELEIICGGSRAFCSNTDADHIAPATLGKLESV